MHVTRMEWLLEGPLLPDKCHTCYAYLNKYQSKYRAIIAFISNVNTDATFALQKYGFPPWNVTLSR